MCCMRLVNLESSPKRHRRRIIVRFSLTSAQRSFEFAFATADLRQEWIVSISDAARVAKSLAEVGRQVELGACARVKVRCRELGVRALCNTILSDHTQTPLPPLRTNILCTELVAAVVSAANQFASAGARV